MIQRPFLVLLTLVLGVCVALGALQTMDLDTITLSAGDTALATRPAHSSFAHDLQARVRPLRMEEMDMAHAAIWRSFREAQLVAEGPSSTQGPSPQNLTVVANGRLLPQAGGHREGKVNANMITVSARWSEFRQHGTWIELSLEGNESRRYGRVEPNRTRSHGCELERLQDGILAHFGDNPEKEPMMLVIRYKLGDNKKAIERSWQVTTADTSSGDAQGEIMFRHSNFSGHALKEKKRKDAGLYQPGQNNTLLAKEVTIFDLANRVTPPNIESNGFELDSTRMLTEPVSAFINKMLDSNSKKRYSIRSHKQETLNMSRANLMHLGIQLAVAPEEYRAKVLADISEEIQNASEVLRVVHDAMDLGTQLLEKMEEKSVAWWRQKKNSTAQLKSACFSVNYRHTRAGVQGLPIAHIDATSVGEWFREGGGFPLATQARAEWKFGMNMSEALKHVVVTFNEWVNADEQPIVELPLAMMDITTLQKGDLDLHWFQLSQLESMAVRWSDAQTWWYKNLAQGEGYIFITSPHEGPDNMLFQGTPHSAFKFKRSPGSEAERERQSIEMRCLVIDPSWHSPGAAGPMAQEIPNSADQKAIQKELSKGTKAAILNQK